MFMEAALSHSREYKYVRNFKSDRYLFRIYNAVRPEGHSANGIKRDNEEMPIAVHCNCGKFHPVVLDIGPHSNEYESNRTKVDWSIEDSKLDNLLKKIKKMWAGEGI